MPNNQEELKDEIKNCVDCGKEFTFTVNDQKFFQEKGYAPRKRCANCAKLAKQNRNAR